MGCYDRAAGAYGLGVVFGRIVAADVHPEGPPGLCPVPANGATVELDRPHEIAGIVVDFASDLEFSGGEEEGFCFEGQAPSTVLDGLGEGVGHVRRVVVAVERMIWVEGGDALEVFGQGASIPPRVADEDSGFIDGDEVSSAQIVAEKGDFEASRGLVEFSAEGLLLCALDFWVELGGGGSRAEDASGGDEKSKNGKSEGEGKLSHVGRVALTGRCYNDLDRDP